MTLQSGVEMGREKVFCHISLFSDHPCDNWSSLIHSTGQQNLVPHRKQIGTR